MTSTQTTRRNSIAGPDPAFGERLRLRDPEAMERFFDSHFGLVYARVRRLVPNTHEAEDLTQDIFLNIHRSLPSYDPRRSLGAWVSAIAMNRIRDHWRARGRARESDRIDGSSPPPAIHSERPESELEQQECDDEVKQAVYRLPLGMRSVLLLRFYDGLAFPSIARVLKLTPAAARKRYSRALQLLRGSLSLEGARP